MNKQLLKKAAAISLAAVLVTGGVPMQPIADIAENFSITASADTQYSGQCGSCFWDIDDEGTLTIHAGTLPNGTSERAWS